MLLLTIPGISAQEALEDEMVWMQPHRITASEERQLLLPGASYYLGEEKLNKFRVDDINRALRDVPGVYIREEDGYGLFPNISLRGVDTTRNSKLTIMEDGIPTAPAPYSAPAAYYTPTVGRMEAIEVVKGSSQLRHGPHTTGGAINYVSARIPDDRSGHFELQGGEYGDIRARGRWGETFETDAGQVGVLMESYFHRNNGYKSIDAAGDYPGSDDTGFNRTDYTLKLGWSPNGLQGHSFEAKVGYTDLHTDFGYLGLAEEDFEEDPFRLYAAAREDQMDTYHTRTYLRHFWDISPRIRMVNTFYYNNFHRNWFKLHDIRDIDADGNGVVEGDEPGGSRVGEGLSEALAGSQNGAALEVLKGERAGRLRVRANNRDYELWGLQSKLLAEMDTGPVNHALEVSLRWHYDEIRRFQWNETFDQDSNGNFVSSVVSEGGSDGNRLQQTRALALYVSDTMRIGNWTIEPGVRWENLDLESTDFTSDSTNTITSQGEGDLNVFAPGIGVSWQQEEFVLFGGIYRGFSVPNPRANVRNGIEEETSTAIEFGARYQPNNSFYTEAVYFHTDFNDLLVVNNIGGGGSTTTQNVGEASTQGVELLARYDLGVAENQGFNLPITATMTFTDATLDGNATTADPESIFSGGQDGNRIPYIPRWQFSLGAGFEMDRWAINISGTYAGSSFSNAAEVSNELNPVSGSPDSRFGEIDSRFILDLSASYRFYDTARLFLIISNLTNSEYLASRHPEGLRPGAPRVAAGGVRWDF